METGSRLKGIAVPSNLSINLSLNQNKLNIKKNIVASLFCWLKYLALDKKQPYEEAEGLKQPVGGQGMAPPVNTSNASLRPKFRSVSPYKKPGVAVHTSNPGARGTETGGFPKAHWPASLAESLCSRLSGRPCGGQQMKSHHEL